MPNSIFRIKPPIELLEEILSSIITFEGSKSGGWFQKSFISLKPIEMLLPELEPYYLPCIFKEYTILPFTHDKAITMIRQILKTHSMKLVRKEKSIKGVRGIWYNITSNNILTREIKVDFS